MTEMAELPRPSKAVRRGLRIGTGVGASYLALRGLCKAYRTVKRRSLRALLFQAVLPTLRQAGITFFVDFGTLRSLYKDADIFMFDNDADVVVVEPDFQKILHELKLPKGYTMGLAGTGEELGGGIRAQWFGGYVQEGKVRVNKNQHTWVGMPTPMVLPLKQMQVKVPGAPAQDVPVPADVEMVLRTRYNIDWHIDKYASKGADTEEHEKLYLRILRWLGRIGLRV